MQSYSEFLTERRYVYRPTNKPQYGTTGIGPKNTGGKLNKHQEMELAKSGYLKKRNISGWNVLPTIHASARAAMRRQEFHEKDWKNMHRKVLDEVDKSGIEAGNYVFYSRSNQQGYVTYLDPDKRTLRIITVLPKGRSRIGATGRSDGTKKIMVENITEQQVEQLLFNEQFLI